jgi:Protein of unknown function (DUF2934)
MPRKTTGSTTTRSKKNVASIQPNNLQSESHTPQNGASTGSAASVNLEEQIRVRAYELYLQRRATAGSANGSGNENQDWLIAEREILSRNDGPGHHSA